MPPSSLPRNFGSFTRRRRSYIDAEFSPQEYGVATKKGSDFSTLCDDLVKGWLADGTIEQLIKDNGLD